MNKIHFHDFNIKSHLSKKQLKLFILKLFKNEQKVVERVDIIFTTDEYLLGLNKSFLSHNFYTDTITFTLQDTPIIGEAYISINRVKENCIDYKIPYKTELIRVIIHSCLHLCGYNDKVKIEAKNMEVVQERYLNIWIVSRETQIGR